jgi:hypothetical protein
VQRKFVVGEWLKRKCISQKDFILKITYGEVQKVVVQWDQK